MNVSRTSLFFFLTTSILVFGCSSSGKNNKAAATGSAKSATTKQPPSAPKPAKKAGTNVSGNVSSAVAVDQDTCTADEDGLAACADTYVVFCSQEKVWALDCAEAYGGTCAELDDGTVDCVVDQ